LNSVRPRLKKKYMPSQYGVEPMKPVEAALSSWAG
jgi:hypothetical protein